MRYQILALPAFFALFCSVLYLQNVSLENIAYAFFIILLFNFFYLILKYAAYSKKIKFLMNFSSEQADRAESLSFDSELYGLYIENMGKSLLSFRDEMRKKDEELQEIKDNISLWAHQIKTPLTALKIELKDDKNRLFEINEYVNSLMQLVRLGDRGSDFVFERLNLFEAVKAELRYFAPLFISKGLNLELRIDEEIAIISDKKWLSFVLRQLISNAVKYTKKGFVKLYILENSLVIEDSGIGILSEDIPRIFERSYTGKNGRIDKSASGLGLYLSKKICDMLNLGLRLESDTERGTKIFINLQNCKI